MFGSVLRITPRRAVAAAVAGAALATGALLVPGQASGAPAPFDMPSFLKAAGSSQLQVVTLTNAARAQAGCGALTVNSNLNVVAQEHASDMAANNYFSHNSLNGQTPFDRMRAGGAGGGWMAENIAWGQTTPDQVVSAWMASPSHRANLLNCNLKRIGIGYAVSASGRTYWVQDFNG